MASVEAIRELVEGKIPFLAKLGLKLGHAGPASARLLLPYDHGNDNYVGTVHAGALFTFGETAAGVAAGLAFDLSRVSMLAREATIEYLKPAKSALVATSRIPADEVGATSEKIEREGKATLVVGVEMTDGSGEAVARMAVKYHFRKGQR